MSRVSAAYTCANLSGPRSPSHAHDTELAEQYLRQLSALPLEVEPSSPARQRVAEQLTAAMRILREEPRLAEACTRALLGAHDPPASVRSRIGAEVHRRVASTVGAGAWPEVVTTLETIFWGELIQAQTTSLDYPAAAARLETMVSLVLPD